VRRDPGWEVVVGERKEEGEERVKRLWIPHVSTMHERSIA